MSEHEIACQQATEGHRLEVMEQIAQGLLVLGGMVGQMDTECDRRVAFAQELVEGAVARCFTHTHKEGGRLTATCKTCGDSVSNRTAEQVDLFFEDHKGHAHVIQVRPAVVA